MSQDCPMLRLKDDSVCSKDDDFSFLRIYGSSTHTHLYFSVSKVSSVNLTSSVCDGETQHTPLLVLNVIIDRVHHRICFEAEKHLQDGLHTFGAFLALKSPNELAKPDLNACVPPKLRYLLTAKPDETGRP